MDRLELKGKWHEMKGKVKQAGIKSDSVKKGDSSAGFQPYRSRTSAVPQPYLLRINSVLEKNSGF